MVKKLAVLDWDGTLRRGFTIKTWIRFLVKENLFDSEVEIKLLEFFNDYECGKLNHDSLADATANFYAQSLKDTREDDILLAAYKFLNEDKTLLYPFTIPLTSFLKDNNIDIIVISGAPAEVIRAQQKKLKIDRVFALECETKNGIYTGSVRVNTGISSEKSKVISYIKSIQKYNFYLAMGNSNSDIPMLEAAPVNAIVNNPSLSSFIDCNKRILLLEENSSFSDIINFFGEDKLN